MLRNYISYLNRNTTRTNILRHSSTLSNNATKQTRNVLRHYKVLANYRLRLYHARRRLTRGTVNVDAQSAILSHYVTRNLSYRDSGYQDTAARHTTRRRRTHVRLSRHARLTGRVGRRYTLLVAGHKDLLTDSSTLTRQGQHIKRHQSVHSTQRSLLPLNAIPNPNGQRGSLFNGDVLRQNRCLLSRMQLSHDSRSVKYNSGLNNVITDNRPTHLATLGRYIMTAHANTRITHDCANDSPTVNRDTHRVTGASGSGLRVT